MALNVVQNAQTYKLTDIIIIFSFTKQFPIKCMLIIHYLNYICTHTRTCTMLVQRTVVIQGKYYKKCIMCSDQIGEQKRNKEEKEKRSAHNICKILA